MHHRLAQRRLGIKIIDGIFVGIDQGISMPEHLIGIDTMCRFIRLQYFACPQSDKDTEHHNAQKKNIYC